MLCSVAFLLFLPVCAQSTGQTNLAFNKPAQQSSNYSQTFPASKAVNGIIDANDDFSHTLSYIPGWWKVDLQVKYNIGKIELYNREGFHDRLAKVSLYTSNLVSPANFTTSPSNWTWRRSHQEAYGAVGIEEFSSPIEGRHVLVYCEASNGLALEEVMVYEYNYIISGTATSSGTNSGFPPGASIDGDLGTVSSTDGAAADNLWWKVRLDKRILLRKVFVYVRDGACGDGACINRLSKVSYLTNKRSTEVNPNTNGAGGWSVCFYSETALGAEYDVSCGVGVYPLTKELGIHSGGVEVGLRELQLFGFELPQLSHSIDGRTDQQGAISVRVSFLQWNLLMVGGQPPSEYKVELNGVVHVLPHNTSIERQSTLFTGLNSKQDYEWKVTCITQGVNCPGSKPTFTASTVCKAPKAPELETGSPSCMKVTNSGRQRWKCTLTWREPTQKFCPGQVSYILQGPVEKTTMSLSAEFYIDGDEPFKIRLRANNSDKFLSPEVTASGRTGVLVPQFGSSTFTVAGSDPDCVRLTWQKPEYPGGNITTYHYKCSSGDWVTTTARTKTLCGYNPYTNITCYLKAKHSLTSAPITASDFTPCAVPTAPRDLSYTSTESTKSSLKQWKYTFTWQLPSSPNCYDAITYRYSVLDWITLTDTTSTQATVYFEGVQRFNFLVEAKNKKGYSAASSKSETTGELVPQFGNRQFQLIAHNSSCVKLTWRAPQYPGGIITHYLIKCQLDKWAQTPKDKTVAFKCGYEPYKEVTCYLMAANSKGNSSQLTNVTRTACAAPQFNKQIKHTEAYDSTKKKRMITVSVNRMAITINCATLDPLQYGVSRTQMSTVDVITDLNATTEYMVAVKATNNMNLSAYEHVTVTTGELAPGTGPNITEKQSVDKTCAVASWEKPTQPNGNIIAYRYKCEKGNNKYSNWTNTTSQSFSVCGYNVGSMVTCEIQAATYIGFGPSAVVVIEIMCDYPQSPKFEWITFKGVNNTANIMITLKNTTSNCHNIRSYIISVAAENDSLVHRSTHITHGKFNITNLKGFTFYTVTVEVLSDFNLTSATTKYVQTTETVVPGKPSQVLSSFNESCVKVEIIPPQNPNGVITRYLVSCAVLLESQNKLVIPTSTSNRELTSICNLPSATRIHCSVEAYNSIGKSEPTSGFIFTQLKLQTVKTQHLQVQAVSKEDATAKITIKMVQVDKGDVSSYFVLVEKLFQHPISKKSTAKPACSIETFVGSQSGDVESAEKCYLAAELSADEVGQEYVFTIGDDKNYGGFHNKPLEQGAEYNVYLGFQAGVENNSVKLSKLLAPLSFDFLPAKCPPPAAIKGAAASLTGTATAGQTVFYACTAGFVKVGGDFQLTCQRGDNDEYGWRGTPLICSKGVWEGVGSAIGLLFLALVLSIGFSVFKLKISTKRKNPQVYENAAGLDANGEKFQNQETGFNNVYDIIKDKPPKPASEYESVDMQAVGTDHIYASTQ